MSCRKRFIIVIIISILFPLLIAGISNFFNKEPKVSSSRNKKTIVIKNTYYSYEMDVEDFIPYVVLNQMSMDEPKELIKAQSVVVRTYILKKMKNNDKITTKELGLSYRNYADLKKQWFSEYCRDNITNAKGVFNYFFNLNSYNVFNERMNKIKNIVTETKRKVMRKDGELILPLFHCMSNGKTRDGKKLLGNEYEYLKSVRCEKDIISKECLNTYAFTPKQFLEKLQKNGIVIYKDKKELDSQSLDTLMKIIKLQKDEQGYVISCTIGDTVIMGEKLANALEIASSCIELRKEKNVVEITTKGKGHGFGMSLWYARYLAQEGKNYEEILKTFYDMGIVNV